MWKYDIKTRTRRYRIGSSRGYRRQGWNGVTESKKQDMHCDVAFRGKREKRKQERTFRSRSQNRYWQESHCWSKRRFNKSCPTLVKSLDISWGNIPGILIGVACYSQIFGYIGNSSALRAFLESYKSVPP